ncbi:HAD domain-containing protein [Caballeronia sp. KNU42]
MKTLFLVIDGVLHPTTVGELEYDEAGSKVTGAGVCALEAELTRLVAGKDVDIVVHSTWIYMFDAAKLQADYLPTLGAVARIRATKRQIESRSARVMDYVRRMRLTPDDYLILDDAPKEFAAVPALAARLVVCDPTRGIDDPDVLAKLKTFLG